MKEKELATSLEPSAVVAAALPLGVLNLPAAQAQLAHTHLQPPARFKSLEAEALPSTDLLAVLSPFPTTLSPVYHLSFPLLPHYSTLLSFMPIKPDVFLLVSAAPNEIVRESASVERRPYAVGGSWRHQGSGNRCLKVWGAAARDVDG